MLSKLICLPLQDTAVSFMRIILPMRALKREKLVKDTRIEPFSGENQFQSLHWNESLYLMMCMEEALAQKVLTGELTMEEALKKDNPKKVKDRIIWTPIAISTDTVARILNLREKFGMRWVVDMDDNFFDVSKDNPGADKAVQAKRYIERCLSLADGLTVSVPSLKKLYAPYNNHIYVMPNGLDFYKPYMGNDPITGKGTKKSWEELRTKKRKKNKRVRIGWEGAYGHRADLSLVAPVIAQLQKDYEIDFVTFGWNPPNIKSEWHDWVGFPAYPEKLASLNLDIGVAPLVDSGYNRCKSNLRYLEYSALGIPTVLSPTENQKGMVALEASTPFEWYNHLEKLILDEQYRKELGEKANVFVKENYDARKFSPGLAEWFSKLPRREDIAPDKLQA